MRYRSKSVKRSRETDHAVVTPWLKQGTSRLQLRRQFTPNECHRFAMRCLQVRAFHLESGERQENGRQKPSVRQGHSTLLRARCADGRSCRRGGVSLQGLPSDPHATINYVLASKVMPPCSIGYAISQHSWLSHSSASSLLPNPTCIRIATEQRSPGTRSNAVTRRRLPPGGEHSSQTHTACG